MLDKINEKKVKETILRFIDPNKYKAFIFGSRASGSAREFSDLDIGIKGENPVPGNLIVELKGAFEESDLPFRVDVVDFSFIPDNFAQIASHNTIPLN